MTDKSGGNFGETASEIYAAVAAVLTVSEKVAIWDWIGMGGVSIAEALAEYDDSTGLLSVWTDRAWDGYGHALLAIGWNKRAVSATITALAMVTGKNVPRTYVEDVLNRLQANLTARVPLRQEPVEATATPTVTGREIRTQDRVRRIIERLAATQGEIGGLGGYRICPLCGAMSRTDTFAHATDCPIQEARAVQVEWAEWDKLHAQVIAEEAQREGMWKAARGVDTKPTNIETGS